MSVATKRVYNKNPLIPAREKDQNYNSTYQGFWIARRSLSINVLRHISPLYFDAEIFYRWLSLVESFVKD